MESLTHSFLTVKNFHEKKRRFPNILVQIVENLENMDAGPIKVIIGS